MSNIKTELQYRIALGILGQMCSAGLVNDQGGRDHPAAGSREIPPGNCSGIVMDIPAQVW